MTDHIEVYKKRIIEILGRNSKKCVPYKELYSKCKGRRPLPDKFKEAVLALKKDGTIFERKAGFVLCAPYGIYTAEVARVAGTFGFLKKEDGTEVFVPGKFLKGAMPGDKVLAKPLTGRERRGSSPEGEVVKIIEENFSEFAGVIEKYNGRLYIRPDTLSKDPLEIAKLDIDAKPGDKVLAQICSRGERHSEHLCRVTELFGSSSKAASSAAALLRVNGIETEFPSEVMDEARRIGRMKITADEISKRLDLRDEIIFTIDGADTKDIDDAVSLSRNVSGWKLGVHIADVSHYVKSGSAIDNDAFARGTSLYYADKVVPMLPRELSNGVCSLNPNEDRLAFSCLMELNEDADVTGFKFSKTVIRSRVKGVYSEINTILDCNENVKPIPDGLAEKYSGLTDTLYLMKELADILIAKKKKRGVPPIETPECKIITDENGVCTDLVKKESGISENIIEEFMVLANSCAAKLAKEREVPFVYRVHESPSPEKIEELKDIVSELGLPVPKFTHVKPVHLAEILESAKEKPFSLAVNNMVLRSMAKAKYSDEPLGHFGLVLNDYSHFTSPIRRYPDLAIHRILTDLCYSKLKNKALVKRYAGFAKAAAAQSSECEINAMRTERSCEDCYAAEYMSAHIGEVFDGIVSSVTEYGFYVELPNTAEGFVRIESLHCGSYEYDGRFTVYENGSKLYSVGDRVKVLCAAADVSSGRIDFTVEDKN